MSKSLHPAYRRILKQRLRQREAEARRVRTALSAEGGAPSIPDPDGLRTARGPSNSCPPPRFIPREDLELETTETNNEQPTTTA